MRLSILIYAEEEPAVIFLSGDLDLSEKDAVQAVLTAIDSDVAIEAEGLAFIDSSGVHALLSVVRRGHQLTIRHPRPNVRRVFELLGLGGMLD